jgi:hypothetical protein
MTVTENLLMKKMGVFFVILFFLLVIFTVPVQGDYYYNYYTYDEMINLLRDFESQAAQQAQNVFSLQSIGDSYEGNPVYAVKFSDNPEVEEENEPVIVIDAGIHGNEILGQYNPWLWEETFCELSPDYFSRRAIPSILFEYPFFAQDYGVVDDGLYGQFDRDDQTDNKYPSSGDAVEWFLERSLAIYNYLVKQSRYIYSPRDYTDMSRKPGPTVEDLALVGAKISEVGSGLPGCLFFDESDGRDLLTRGSKRISWNVQNLWGFCCDPHYGGGGKLYYQWSPILVKVMEKINVDNQLIK